MKFLLVDAFPMLRVAITGLIAQHFAGASVRGVDSTAAAREELARDLPRLVMLDLRVPGCLELLLQIRRDHLLLPVVVISGDEQAEDAMRAIAAGAAGYVPERSDLPTVLQALQLVLAGGTYVPPLKAGAVVPLAPAAALSGAWAELPLTPRQKGVLDLLVRGLANKEIARELNVSVDTVKDHVAAVLKALGASSRTQAVLIATQKSRG